MKANPFGKKDKITITSINLKYRGEVHSVGGIKSKESVFSVTIPFTNRPYSNYATDYLIEASAIKKSDFDPIVLKGITAMPPFKVLEVEPRLPAKIGPEERIEFKIKIEGPQMSYMGPMVLDFVEENCEFVHLEISKTEIEGLGKDVVLDPSINMLNMPKNAIFGQNIQFRKVFEFGTAVKEINVDKPFEIVSTMPKLPFTVSDAGSFIVTLYIKAPSENYVGPLIIHVR